MSLNLAGRSVTAQWTKCSVRLENVGRIPDGNYFLYTDEGQSSSTEVHRRQVALPDRGRLIAAPVPQTTIDCRKA